MYSGKRHFKVKECAVSNGLRILIVEDDFTSRVLLQEVMRSYGTCHVAVNGKEAIMAFEEAILSQNPYHLIFLDIMMPEMDGQETLRLIRSIEQEHGIMIGRGVKIIMATSHGDSRNIMESFNELCDAYLVKPIQLEKLIKELHSLGLIQ
jgi:two-component system chemotaxis response regulator CheY